MGFRMADLKPGFYWTRAHGYVPLSIAEWNGEKWFHPGVESTSRPEEIEVMSKRLLEPRDK